jgi:toxin ParE1/3/4
VKVRWTRKAERCLYEIGDYIALDDPKAAVRWIRQLRDRVRRASALPGTGRVVPELQREDIREVLLRNYRLMYRVDKRELVVIEGHKLLPDDLDPDADLLR